MKRGSAADLVTLTSYLIPLLTSNFISQMLVTLTFPDPFQSSQQQICMTDPDLSNPNTLSPQGFRAVKLVSAGE